MKWFIEGFDQEGLVKLGLDVIDAVILDYFTHFYGTGDMKCIHDPDGGFDYGWVNYQYFIDELPAVGITSRRSMARRFQKLCDAGVLEFKLSKEIGTYCFYRKGPKYRLLDTKGAVLKSTPPVLQETGGSTLESRGGVLLSTPKDSSSTDSTSSKKNKITPDSIPYRLAKLLFNEHQKIDPKFLEGKNQDEVFQRWGADIEKLIRIDGRNEHQIARIVRWSQADPFWNSNILSGQKLREKFDQLVVRSKNGMKSDSLTNDDAAALNSIGFALPKVATV